MNKKVTVIVLAIIVVVLAGILIVKCAMEKEETGTIEVSSLSSVEVTLGEKIELPTYKAAKGDGEDVTSQVKVKAELTEDKSVTKAMEPIFKTLDGKEYLKLTYAGDYKVTYTLTGEEGQVLDEKSFNVSCKENKDFQTKGIPICMYHYVYEENDVPSDLNNNYISTKDLREELEYLTTEKYYYPTWGEVRDYIDGKLILPAKSIVLTFDDGAKNFLKLGIPIFQEYKVPVTSFLITSKEGEEKVKKYSGDYVSFQSHSHNMHRPGGNIGHGGVFTALSEEEAISDLEKSIKICGNSDAFAYPFGDYTDDCEKYVEKAGFKCAVTTNYGKVRPGDDPYLLNRVRMFQGQSLDAFIGAIE